MSVKGVLRLLWIYKKTLLVLATPLILLPLVIVVKSPEAKCGYTLLVMAVFWTGELLPLAVTALIPLLFLPLLGVQKSGDVTANYFKPTNMMMFGSLTVALAIEKSNLHRRIALGVLKLVGSRPTWLMAGFMLPTWFLSMWISNTATTSMMIPVVEAVLQELEGSTKRDIPEVVEDIDFNIHKDPEPIPTVHERTIGVGAENPAFQDDQLKSDSYIPHNQTNGYIPMNHLNNKDKETSVIKFQGATTFLKENHKKGSSFNLQNEAEPSENPTEGIRSDAAFRNLCKAYTLCVCYAANAGGTATLTGTSPNLIMKGQVDAIWESKGLGRSPVNFSTYMIFGLPTSTIIVILTWLWLLLLYFGWRQFLPCCFKDIRDPEKEAAVTKIIDDQYKKLGPLRFEEAAMVFFFTLMILLWFFRQPEFMPGWASFFLPGYTADMIPAIFISLILYFFPSRWPWKLGNEVDVKGPVPSLMSWQHVQAHMPWGILLLMGGGFALADACQKSGLSKWIADQLTALRALPSFALVFILCFMVAMLTEVTSNSATATLLMPIMAALSESLKKNPLYLMFPVAISTSFAYMLPVATPPNAIAFSFGRIKVIDMIKAGAILNVLAVLVVTIATHTWGMAYFKLDTLPWAVNVTVQTTSIGPDLTTTSM